MASAQDAIKRRNELRDIIEKNDNQIIELERQRVRMIKLFGC